MIRRMVCTSLETAHAAVVQLVYDFAAFQTIRYGWSVGTPLAVLTDF